MLAVAALALGGRPVMLRSSPAPEGRCWSAHYERRAEVAIRVAILAGPGGPVLGFLSWDFRLKWLMGSWPWARFVRAWSCLRVGAGRVSREC